MSVTCDVFTRSGAFDLIDRSANRRGRSVEVYRHHH